MSWFTVWDLPLNVWAAYAREYDTHQEAQRAELARQRQAQRTTGKR